LLNQKKSKNNEVDDLTDLNLEDDEVKEYSTSASIGGGPSLPIGLSTPTFGQKRKASSQAVAGYRNLSLAELLDK
tara:strand:+ start:2986 stop:3210 length:225 start_codon:yes stop_codon:yes gene_type:complete